MAEAATESGRKRPVDSLTEGEEEEESFDGNEGLDNSELDAKTAKIGVRKRRCSSSHVRQIKFDHLRLFFETPMPEAAKSLNVSLATLRKICRREKIREWPYKQIKALESTIKSLEEEASNIMPVLQDRRGSLNSLMRNLYRQKQSLIVNGAPLEITEQFSSDFNGSWPAKTPEDQKVAANRPFTTPKPTAATDVPSPYLPSGATSSPADSARGSLDASTETTRASSSSPTMFNPLNMTMPTPMPQRVASSLPLASFLAAEHHWMRMAAEVASAARAMHPTMYDRYPSALYGSLARGPAMAATPPPHPSMSMHCRHPVVGASMSMPYLPHSYMAWAVPDAHPHMWHA